MCLLSDKVVRKHCDLYMKILYVSCCQQVINDTLCDTRIFYYELLVANFLSQANVKVRNRNVITTVTNTV